MGARPIGIYDAFLMVVLILFWGSSFVVVKLALGEGLTPIAIATYRFLVAGALFVAVLLFRKSRSAKYKLRIEMRDAASILALALMGVSLFFAAQYTGIRMAGASIAAILVCLLSPILITTLSAHVFKERLSKRQILGIVVAASGTFTIVVGGGALSLQAGSDFLVGVVILLSTPFLWTAYTLMGRKTVEKYDAFLVVAYVNILGGLCLVPFSWVEGSLPLVLAMSPYGWSAILFLAVTCSVMGYYIWFRVLTRVDASKASSFLFGEPLITAIFAVMFTNETLGTFTVFGGLLIFVGVFLVNRK